MITITTTTESITLSDALEASLVAYLPSSGLESPSVALLLVTQLQPFLDLIADQFPSAAVTAAAASAATASAALATAKATHRGHGPIVPIP